MRLGTQDSSSGKLSRAHKHQQHSPTILQCTEALARKQNAKAFSKQNAVDQSYTRKVGRKGGGGFKGDTEVRWKTTLQNDTGIKERAKGWEKREGERGRTSVGRLERGRERCGGGGRSKREQTENRKNGVVQKVGSKEGGRRARTEGGKTVVEHVKFSKV